MEKTNVPKLVQQRRKNKFPLAEVFSRPHLYTKEARAHVNIASIVKTNPISSAIKLELFVIILKLF